MICSMCDSVSQLNTQPNQPHRYGFTSLWTRWNHCVPSCATECRSLQAWIFTQRKQNKVLLLAVIEHT